ncbi:MAG: TIGR00366 family protein [Gammaproteobacteria bacterium]|nr:TIGR00366 family protein [Gammaproteobacteria bacterium]MBU1555567.1 TIGR00366 family protein [Gammaproteobacteria bacterium]MBU2071166.1 TIGR00366 family protein [Gammaproteobacteria bacterium]MBU2206234.1 TIGR00366 family protein [Gammaproteobacteria bacterium]
MTKFKVPHTLTLLFSMMVLAMIATWIVPQGFFDTQTLANGRTAVIPGTFTLVEERQYLTPWQLLTAIPRAFASAQDVIFFVMILGGVLSIARATGTVDALIGRLLERYGNKPQMLIFMVVFCFAMASSFIGTAGEYIPFVLILVALCKAMRLDAMTAVGMTVAGYGIGYGVSAFNPFTVIIAQQIADLPPMSGNWLRFAIFVPFVLIGFHHVWSYSKKVLANPENSMVKDLPCPLIGTETAAYPPLTWAHRLILASFVLTIGIVAYNIRANGWYLYELGAAFIAWGLFITVIGKVSADVAANKFIAGAMELTTTAMLIGVARGISLIMEDGQILHSLVHGMSTPLSYVGAEAAAVGMLVIQTLLNFFIPSGSGQAYVTMPLMVPVADLLEIPRQVAVLAYQFGDGFSNMIIPTNAVLMGIIGIAGIPYGHWFRFCLPLMLKLMLASSLVLVLAIIFGYGLDLQPAVA